MTLLQLLPAGFALPPLPYLLVLVVGLGAVALGLRRRAPAFTDRHVVAFVPWIVAGSATHALYVVDALPAVVEPFAGTPAVYATVALVAGVVWLVADTVADEPTVPSALGACGVGVGVLTVGVSLGVGVARGTLSPGWSAVALVVGLAVGVAAWTALGRLVPRVAVVGSAGLVAVSSHALDGVSTAVGVDVLGFGERTPLSRVIIETAASLPTADVLGSGWLFVLVKLAVVSVVVVLFADLMEDDPREGRALLGVVAAVGLGPGVHNLILFAISG
jgi:uncharacterized membrane protein